MADREANLAAIRELVASGTSLERAGQLVAQANRTKPSLPTAPAAQPESGAWNTFGTYLGKPAVSAAQGITFGLADEGIAALGSLPAIFTDETVPDRYNAILDNARGAAEQYRKESPVVSGISEALGAVASPVGKLKYIKELGGMSRALLEGGAYGFGSGEGGVSNRLKDAGISAALGGAATGAGQALGRGGAAIKKKLPGIAQTLEQSALGITAADRTKAIKNTVSKWGFEHGLGHPLDNAIKTAKKYGVLKGGVDPEMLKVQNQEAIGKIRKSVTSILKQADEVSTKPVKVNFKNANAFVNPKTSRASGDERKQLAKLLRKEKNALNEEFDGTLATLQRIKANFNSKTYATDSNATQKKLYKQLTRDLKEAIENKVDDLVSQGKLDKKAAGKVRELNAESGDLFSLQDIFTRQAAKAGAQDPMKAIYGAIRTTGGVGMPVLAGMAAGSPMLGLGAGLTLAAARTPRGRTTIADALLKLGQIKGDPSDILRRLTLAGANQ